MSYGTLKLLDGKPRVFTTLSNGIWSNDIPVFLFDNLKDFKMEANESVLVRYEKIVLDDKDYAFIIEYRITSNMYNSAFIFPFDNP